MRNEIERVIKEMRLDRSRCFECSKLTYRSILRTIEQVFVLHGGDIHWSNMGGRFNNNLLCQTKDISANRMWVTRLPRILPQSDQPVYALFEDSVDFHPKYWVYELYLPELICIVSEVCGLDDFYIVSKKFDWLISECHEDIVSFVGDSFDLSCFEDDGSS